MKKKGNPVKGEKETKHILIIEDKISLRKRYVDILTSLHYTVFEANNNAAAIHFFKTFDKEIHLLITNIERKDGNAFELLANLHRYLPYYIPVVLISAQKDNYKNAILKAKEYKGVKLIDARIKPITVNSFIYCVAALFGPTYPYFPSYNFLTQIDHANALKKNDFTAIMLVDDDPIMLNLYEKMLTGLPYNLFKFKEGHSALCFLSYCPIKIDLIITNIRMPFIDAYELFRISHKSLLYPIPALVITSLFTPDLKENFMSRNYNPITLVDVLPKPIDFVTFHKAICNALPNKAINCLN